MQPKDRIIAKSFRPIHDQVFVTNLESGPLKTSSGIIIPDDNMTERGIRPRWCKVYAVGPKVTDLVPGEWVLVEHARWTNAIEMEFPEGTIRMWRIDYPASVLIACDHNPVSSVETTL